MRRIYLVTGSRLVMSRALAVLGSKVAAYNTSEYWIGVARAEYLNALVVLKSYGIEAEIRE